MSRSQRHKITVQGYDSSGDRNEQGASNPATKPVTLSGISPNTAVAGGADATVTMTGTNFSAPMFANFGSTALPVTVASATSATFVAPVAARVGAGTVSVLAQVGPFSSGAQTFTFT